MDELVDRLFEGQKVAELGFFSPVRPPEASCLQGDHGTQKWGVLPGGPSVQREVLRDGDGAWVRGPRARRSAWRVEAVASSSDPHPGTEDPFLISLPAMALSGTASEGFCRG